MVADRRARSKTCPRDWPRPTCPRPLRSTGQASLYASPVNYFELGVTGSLGTDSFDDQGFVRPPHARLLATLTELRLSRSSASSSA